MVSFGYTVLLIATLVAGLTTAAPQAQKRDIITIAPTTVEPEARCVYFENPFCNTRYSFANFPNPRQQEHSLPSIEEYIEDANREFQHFYPLLNPPCSDKLATLLCFLYFPFCSPGSDLVVYPCRELCEEITDPDSECTQWLNSYGLEWGKHFDCRNFKIFSTNETVYKEKSCAAGTIPPPATPRPRPPTDPDDKGIGSGVPTVVSKDLDATTCEETTCDIPPCPGT